ncbi:hypothetical protein GVN24_29885 [Rhizobium sp. CRIBSB]|nr:hypothetical protein [Rhizobium sp. CRIBSB]
MNCTWFVEICSGSVMNRLVLSLILSFGLFIAAPVSAQDEAESHVDEILVLARRSGAPMWTVSQGGRSLILV